MNACKPIQSEMRNVSARVFEERGAYARDQLEPGEADEHKGTLGSGTAEMVKEKLKL